MARTRQPQGFARINWAHPLARGLVFAYQPSAGPIDLVRGDLAVLTGDKSTPILAPYGKFAGGIGARYTNGTGGETFANKSVAISPLSGHMRGAFTGAHASLTANYSRGIGGVSGWAYGTSYSGDVLSPRFTVMGVADYYSTTTVDIWLGDYGKVHSFGFTNESVVAGGLKHYVNGAQLGSAITTAAGTANTSTPLVVGVANNFDYEHVFLWQRLLSADEHRRLDAGDYPLFASPRRIWDSLPTFPSDLGRPKGTMRPTVRV